MSIINSENPTKHTSTMLLEDLAKDSGQDIQKKNVIANKNALKPYNIKRVPTQYANDTTGADRKAMAVITGVETDSEGVECPGAAHDAQTWEKNLNNYEKTVLVDSKATKSNILNEIKNAASQLGPGDKFVLTFACHGGQVKDNNGDESDGKDEVIYVYDGGLLDDDIWNALKEFKPGVEVTTVSDTCSSGTNTDIDQAGNNNATYIHMAGCTDTGSSQGDNSGGVFTSTIGKILQSGAFDNLQSFFNNVKQKVSDLTGGDQKPQLTTSGPNVADVSNQKPFGSSTGGGAVNPGGEDQPNNPDKPDKPNTPDKPDKPNANKWDTDGDGALSKEEFTNKKMAKHPNMKQKKIDKKFAKKDLNGDGKITEDEKNSNQGQPNKPAKPDKPNKPNNTDKPNKPNKPSNDNGNSGGG